MLLGASAPEASAQALRVLGLDLSDWQGSLSQTTWNNFCTNDGRVFVFNRASRGGTTGTYDENAKTGTLSQRYDDLAYIQYMNQATAAGVFAGSYHFLRPDVSGNTGTDEANHFIQMAGPWMRPGYLLPINDLEAGSGSDVVAQFCIDFSNEIYGSMGIRPGIYINGNYSSILQGASQANRDALAKPPPNLPTNASPSVVAPDYPMVWDAHYVTGVNLQTANPKDDTSSFYGPWDDYGVAQPWNMWQYLQHPAPRGHQRSGHGCGPRRPRVCEELSGARHLV